MTLMVIIKQDSFCFHFKILVLVVVDRPEERSQRDQHDDDADGHEYEKDLHGYLASLQALMVTASELSDMPSAASQGGSSPITASGMTVTL